MKLKNSDKLSMINFCLRVNGKPFVVDYPNEPLWDVEGNKLITLFRGRISMKNCWNPEEIEGYYA